MIIVQCCDMRGLPEKKCLRGESFEATFGYCGAVSPTPTRVCEIVKIARGQKLIVSTGRTTPVESPALLTEEAGEKTGLRG